MDSEQTSGNILNAQNSKLRTVRKGKGFTTEERAGQLPMFGVILSAGSRFL